MRTKPSSPSISLVPSPATPGARAELAEAPVADAVPDPVPAELRGVLALFRDQLDGVAFPDVDGARLARLVDDAQRTARERAAALAALQAAERAAALALQALRAGAERGLAYARVYAEGQADREALRHAIDALASAPRPVDATPPRRRGRPPKAAAATLFGDAVVAATGADDAGEPVGALG